MKKCGDEGKGHEFNKGINEKKEMNDMGALLERGLTAHSELNTKNLIRSIQGTSKISKKGQVTVPVEIRSLLGIQDGQDELRFVLEDGVVYVEVVRRLTASELRGFFNKPEDNGHFVLDLNQARQERAEGIMRRTTTTEDHEYD